MEESWRSRRAVVANYCRSMCVWEGRGGYVVLSVVCTWGLQDTTRMSMTVVVREDLCVYAGGAWALWVAARGAK